MKIKHPLTEGKSPASAGSPCGYQRAALLLLLLCWSLVRPVHAGEVTYYYTFGEKDGGVGVVAIDDKTGKWATLPPVAASGVDSPEKLAVSKNGDRLIVSSDASDAVEIYALGKEPKLVSQLHIKDETDDVMATGNHALVLDGGGMFSWIDLDQGKLEKAWDSHGLTPPGNKGEGIFFLPTGNLGNLGNLALVTFQKDNSKGTRFGSRVVVFDLDKTESKFDLQLPRNHPECNIKGNLKEQGPNPEVAFIAPKSDTLALTLDLYGAIAFTKLSSVLEGKWENLDYVSCAQDGSLGNAFPDRGCLFEAGGKERLLISNASPNGGLVLFDVASHKVEQKFAASAGAENPVFLSKSKKVVTCISGKIKTRGDEKQNKIYKPENDLLVFDVAPLENGKDATLERIAFDKPVFRVEAVAPGENDLLFLALGAPEQQSELVLYDLATRKILHREPALGAVERIRAWRKPE